MHIFVLVAVHFFGYYQDSFEAGPISPLKNTVLILASYCTAAYCGAEALCIQNLSSTVIAWQHSGNKSLTQPIQKWGLI
jgi:hypothetical protein